MDPWLYPYLVHLHIPLAPDSASRSPIASGHVQCLGWGQGGALCWDHRRWECICAGKTWSGSGRGTRSGATSRPPGRDGKDLARGRTLGKWAVVNRWASPWEPHRAKDSCRGREGRGKGDSLKEVCSWGSGVPCWGWGAHRGLRGSCVRGRVLSQMVEKAAWQRTVHGEDNGSYGRLRAQSKSLGMRAVWKIWGASHSFRVAVGACRSSSP